VVQRVTSTSLLYKSVETKHLLDYFRSTGRWWTRDMTSSYC